MKDTYENHIFDLKKIDWKLQIIYYLPSKYLENVQIRWKMMTNER